MTSLALGNRVRALVAALLAALLAVTGVVATGLPAHAAAGDVAGATLQWGLKESFRSYLVGPIAHGGWALSGGVTDSPAFSWSAGTGNYDAGLGTGSVSYPGGIRFTGHETPAGSGTFALDVTIADVRVAKTGATTAQLIVDGTSSGTSFPDAVFAEVNLAGATASTHGATVSYTAAPATLTEVGSQIMQRFYAAGTVIDPVTFSWPVEQAPVVAPTATTLTASPSPATVGQTITLTATVAPAAAGTVQFRDGTTALGAPVAVAGGIATFSTATLTAGNHTVTAEFVSSDAAFAGSTSASLPLSVTSPPVADGLAWGISTYVNSANPGRPNPSAANYTAPAAFDEITRLSTWAEQSVHSNGDGTVTISLAGASVNHAKTGGGWLRLADPIATLDGSGNGVVSAIVSYGTMAPPAVFDASQPPVRGPVRVELLSLTGNANSPAPSAGGATWSGLTASWHADFLAYIAGGDGADAWAYASTIKSPTNPTDPARLPSSLSFTLSELPDFSVPSNEAIWAISDYLNSGAPGRVSPAPAAYTAPASYDTTAHLGSWGGGTVTSNDDGTVTLSFQGASVNHAKTGGGWLRLADLEATLDEDGNGTLSALVSYGTMSPPAVFDPAQPPVRGPERVDILELTGNATAPVASVTGASWNGLAGVWHNDLLAYLAGDAAATPAIDAWSYKSTITNTGNADRKPAPISFALLELPEFEGEPGGGGPGTDPEEPAPGTPAATPGTLRWGVKSQFRDYVLGPIAHGSITTSGGAGSSGSEFTFPQSSSAINASSGLGTASFRGSVQFTGHAGVLSVVVGNPTVRITSASSGVLSVATATGRVDFATLALGSAARTVDATGAISYTGIPATLTAAGANGFAGFYRAGDALSPVSFTVGANNPTNGSSTSVRSATATAANTPDATPPATEGLDIEGDPVEGAEVTASASGFEPNEAGILVVIYSEPIVLADDATADADGVVTWTGRLPAGLTGSHTLTFQGSVDRGVVLDIASAEQIGCPIESATLSWGFKESFRSYITGLAGGDWTTADGAGYETPEFFWTETGGAWDGERSSGLEFTGSVRFTGHEGALDTTIANPRLVLDGDRGALFLDVSGTTQDGRPITAHGIEFADLELGSARHEQDGDTVVIAGVPATLTPAGAAAFGTYEAGEALDPITIEIVGGADCAQPLEEAAADLPTPDAVAVSAASPLGWWALAGGVLLALLIVTLVLVLRRRSALRAG